jgi:transposase
LDAVSRQVHLFTNQTYIRAESVCVLLSQLARFYGRGLPIPIFLDNARYQRCAWVQAHARAWGIELELLPSYAPNLNLIERYWKWVKQQGLNAKYHASFAAMQEAILRCVGSAHRDHKAELASLLSWNFQLFSNRTK